MGFSGAIFPCLVGKIALEKVHGRKQARTHAEGGLVGLRPSPKVPKQEKNIFLKGTFVATNYHFCNFFITKPFPNIFSGYALAKTMQLELFADIAFNVLVL